MFEYAAAARTPWLSATSTSKFEKVQLEAARVITGLVRSTQVEALPAKSQLPLISMRLQPITLLKADIWAHFSLADDRRQTLFTVCRQRLKRKDWGTTLDFSVSINSDSIPRFYLQAPLMVSAFHSPMVQASPSQASSHQFTRVCLHPSRETFRFKTLPPSPLHGATPLQSYTESSHPPFLSPPSHPTRAAE